MVAVLFLCFGASGAEACRFETPHGQQIVTVAPEKIIECLAGDTPTVLQDVKVTGPIDLTQIPTKRSDKLTKEQQETLKSLALNRNFKGLATGPFSVRWVDADLLIEGDTELPGLVFGRPDDRGRDPITVFAGQFKVMGRDQQWVRIEGEFALARTAFLSDVSISKAKLGKGLQGDSGLFQSRLTLEDIESHDLASLRDVEVAGTLHIGCTALHSEVIHFDISEQVPKLILDKARLRGTVKLDKSKCLGGPKIFPAHDLWLNDVMFLGPDFLIENLHLRRLKANRMTSQGSFTIRHTTVADELVVQEANFNHAFAIANESNIACADFIRSRFGSMAVDNVTAATPEASNRGRFDMYGIRVTGDLAFYRFRGGSAYLRAARVGGRVSFHASEFDTLDLGHGRFGEAVNFGTSRLGRNANQSGRITLSLEATIFTGRVDLDNAHIIGRANLSYVDFAEGRFLANWPRLGEQVTSVVTHQGANPGGCERLLGIAERPTSVSCSTRSGATCDSDVPESLGRIHDRFERNFRKLDRLQDSTEAFYLAHASDESVSPPIRWTAALIWGYGVRPLLPLLWLGTLLVLCSMALWFGRTRVSTLNDNVRHPDWAKWPVLPIRTASVVRDTKEPKRHAMSIVDAWLLTLAIIFGVKSSRLYLVVDHDRFARAWCLMAAGRVIAVMLVALSIVALTRTVPMVREFIDTAMRIAG